MGSPVLSWVIYHGLTHFSVKRVPWAFRFKLKAPFFFVAFPLCLDMSSPSLHNDFAEKKLTYHPFGALHTWPFHPAHHLSLVCLDFYAAALKVETRPIP